MPLAAGGAFLWHFGLPGMYAGLATGVFLPGASTQDVIRAIEGTVAARS